MKVIGITGGFGTGKTTVARIFKGLGAVVLDADEIAHKVISRSRPAYKRIVKIFGGGILKNKKIDRKRLGEIAFQNKALLRKLCKIIHPLVIRKIKEEISRLKRKAPAAVVVLDVPLLIEAGLLRMVDELIVVKASRNLQIKRCQEKTGKKRQDILARIKAQMPINEKIRFSDFVIDNSGTRNRTKGKVRKIWEQIQQRIIRKKRI